MELVVNLIWRITLFAGGIIIFYFVLKFIKEIIIFKSKKRNELLSKYDIFKREKDNFVNKIKK